MHKEKCVRMGEARAVSWINYYVSMLSEKRTLQDRGVPSSRKATEDKNASPARAIT